MRPMKKVACWWKANVLMTNSNVSRLVFASLPRGNVTVRIL
jgi:hypothetical protein